MVGFCWMLSNVAARSMDRYAHLASEWMFFFSRLNEMGLVAYGKRIRD